MKKTALILCIVFICASCAPPEMRFEVIRYTSETYPPKAEVALFSTKSIEREYIEIAEISSIVKEQSEMITVTHFQKKAGEIGADALIFQGERITDIAVESIDGVPVAVPLRELYGIAIKYTD